MVDQRRIPEARLAIMLGKRERMPAKRMMEMPLPTPNSVTRSPIHITKEEPAISVMTITRAGHTPSAPVSRMPYRRIMK